MWACWRSLEETIFASGGYAFDMRRRTQVSIISSIVYMGQLQTDFTQKAFLGATKDYKDHISGTAVRRSAAIDHTEAPSAKGK